MNVSDKNRIRNYFSNSSKSDEDYIIETFEESANELELKEIARDHWEKLSDEKLDLQYILDRVHFRINTNSIHTTSRLRFLTFYYRVAAILFIPILIAAIFYWVQTSQLKNSYAEICAPKGARIQFTLPDGTKGFLNGGSKLKYQSNFKNNRLLTLVGEGYFDVSKDKSHPFTVQTKYADIQVTGTRFDVCAYEKDPELVTTLEEGSVNIFNKRLKSFATLIAGEQNRINITDGRMVVKNVKTELFTSWKENMLRFDNEPFAEVVKKMERWYGVKIILDKSLKYSENYTLTIKTESLRELMQLLKITTPMNYEINTDTVYVYPSGILNK